MRLYIFSKKLIIPGISFFRQLIRQPFVENTTVVVEQNRYLAAIAVVPVAILGVEVTHLFGGVDLAVTTGVPGARRRLER